MNLLNKKELLKENNSKPCNKANYKILIKLVINLILIKKENL